MAHPEDRGVWVPVHITETPAGLQVESQVLVVQHLYGLQVESQVLVSLVLM